jgi:transposase-like protein
MGIPIQWQIKELGGERNLLGPKIQLPGLLVPGTVRLERERLVWNLCDDRSGFCVEPPDGLLQKFIALRKASDQKICEFASQFGLIQPNAVSPDRGCTRWGSEPIEPWRKLARRAFAVINLACAAMRDDDQDRDKDFQSSDLDEISVEPDTILEDFEADEGFHETGWPFLLLLPEGGTSLPLMLYTRPEVDPNFSPAQVRVEKHEWIKRVVSFEVSEWLRLGHVGWRLSPTVEGWELQVGFDGCLLGALAIQLATEITRASDIFQCSSCGQLYSRDLSRRRPNAGCNNYCIECRDKHQPVRDADRRRRARVARARQLAADGMPIAAIAQELNTKIPTARKWVEKRK